MHIPQERHRLAVGLLVILLASLPGLTLFAADQPLVTDRPDQTDGPKIVQPGQVQIEGGFLFERETDGPDVNTLTVPQLLVRTGLTQRIELRIGGDGFVYLDRENAENRANGSDISLQTKVHLAPQSGFLPETAFIAGLSLPSGGHHVTSDGVDPSLTFIMSYALPMDLGLNANIGFAAPTNGPVDSNRFFEAKTSLSLGIPLTDRLGAFVEYFGSVATEGEGDTHFMDTGFTYLVTNNFGVDVVGGGGITDAAADFFIGFGGAWRFRVADTRIAQSGRRRPHP